MNVLFLALTSALFERHGNDLYLLALLGLAGARHRRRSSFRHFAFVVYGILYGYAGISARMLRGVDSFSAAMAYIAISSTIVIVSLAVLARRFGREE